MSDNKDVPQMALPLSCTLNPSTGVNSTREPFLKSYGCWYYLRTLRDGRTLDSIAVLYCIVLYLEQQGVVGACT